MLEIPTNIGKHDEPMGDMDNETGKLAFNINEFT